MTSNLKIGLSYVAHQIVEMESTASRYGSGALTVFATPAMVGLMENAAMNAVQNHLPEGYGTVGVEISVKHIKATPLGMKVYSEAILTEIDGRRLSFSLRAWDDHGEIGSGTHSRYIVDNMKFMEKIGAV
jgi:predicted thioesterase